MIQKQQPPRSAEADCLVDNCEHYRTNSASACFKPSTVAEDIRTVTDSIVAMSTAMVYHQYELAVEHATEIVNAVQRIQQKQGDL